MKKSSIIVYALLCIFTLTLFVSCESENSNQDKQQELSQEVLVKLADLSFDISNAKAVDMFDEKGVRVGDMFLSFEQIDEMHAQPETKQYHTTNLVKNLPRVITVSVDPDLGTLGSNALNDAIDMYNDIGSQLTFERVAFGLKGKRKAKIEVTAFSEQPSGGFITLGIAAGFPNRKGDPAKGFKINTVWFDLLSPSTAEVAGTMAHEIGHCIGLRHTDYQTRESCGQNVNEGSAGVGAIHIAGTPTDSDQTSLMQSCGPATSFNNNDETAILAIY